MRYGAMNFPIKPVVEEIDTFAALGFDYVELTMDMPMAHHSRLHREQDQISAALRRGGMGLVCHLPTFLVTADLTASLRHASLEEMLASLETAVVLGAEKAVLHPSPMSGLGVMVPELVRPLALDFLARMVDHARELGMMLCLENMFPRNGFGVEPDEFTEIFGLFPDLRMTLDVAHAHIDGGKGQRLRELLARFGERIAHVHVSDNQGKRDDHWELGKGNVDLREVARKLRSIGYDSTITLEVFDRDRQALVASRHRLNRYFAVTG